MGLRNQARSFSRAGVEHAAAKRRVHARRLSLLLWPEGHEPVELRPGERAYVGRHPCNDLPLFTKSASRFHAVVEWRAGAARPEVRDRSSANGTWVDGQRLTGEGPAHVLNGDERLRFGDVEVTLELRCDGQPAPALLPDLDDAVVLFTDVGGSFSDYAFDRQAVQRALLDIEQAGRTGTLRFQADGFGATLTWCMGRVIAAEGGDLDDAEAVVARVLESRQGAFTFSRAFEPIEARVSLSIAAILRVDQEETRRHAMVDFTADPAVEAVAVEAPAPDDATGTFAPPPSLRDNALEDSARYDLGAIEPVDFAFDLYADAPAPQPVAPSGVWTFDVSDVLDAPAFHDPRDDDDDEFVIDIAELGLTPDQVWSA